MLQNANRTLVVVGGPNGSGKSTFAEEYIERFPIPYRMLVSQWFLYANTGDTFAPIAVGEGEEYVQIQPQLFDTFMAGVTKNANNPA